MFDFFDEFDNEDFVIGANLIEEFEREQKNELKNLHKHMLENDENESDCEP